MKNPVIFLNELSFGSDSMMSSEEMLPHVLSTLAAVRAAKRVRNDIVVAGHTPLTGVFLGDGTISLAAVLRGDAHRDEWRFLRSLDQSSPWGAYPDSTPPGELQEIIFQGAAAIGMLWAKQNDSTILSFAFPPHWSDSYVQAQFREMDGTGEITSAEVAIPNLSKPEHVAAHRALISNYGRTMSQSSLIYEGDGFVVRIWFYDHDPPHFHVLTRRDTSDTLAKYKIETLDLLSGYLPPALRGRVEEWARDRREDLMMSWARCRIGQYPFVLGG